MQAARAKPKPARHAVLEPISLHSPGSGACALACQVSGLPTNIPFLRRLAAHPAFAAAELDTSFIGQHLDALTQRAPPPAPVAALAAVTDHLLQVRVRCPGWS